MKRAAARMRREVQNPACRIIRKRSARIGRRLHRRGSVGSNGKKPPAGLIWWAWQTCCVGRAGFEPATNCHERQSVDRLAGPGALGLPLAYSVRLQLALRQKVLSRLLNGLKPPTDVPWSLRKR
jgi:hypothetical protein